MEVVPRATGVIVRGFTTTMKLMGEALYVVQYVVFTIGLEFIKFLFGYEEQPDTIFRAGRPNEGDEGVLFEVVGDPQEPYFFNYNNPEEPRKITAISCLNLNKRFRSPTVQVTDGGLNFSHVTLRITSVKRWSCKVCICVKKDPTMKVTVKQVPRLPNV